MGRCGCASHLLLPLSNSAPPLPTPELPTSELHALNTIHALIFWRRPAGLLVLTLLCGASIYTSYLLAALHETPYGERLNTYRQMGEVLLGEGPCMQRVGRLGWLRLLWAGLPAAVAVLGRTAGCLPLARWRSAAVCTVAPG